MPGKHLAARGESRVGHRDRRGARPTRRDEGEYWAYLTEEQRRWAGCIAVRMPRDFHHGLLGQDLERHVPVELGVSRSVHVTHAAFADLGGDGVGTERGARSQGHG